MKPVVQIFADVVTAMNKDTHVFYLHGHRMEIASTLAEMSANSALKYQKFPLICLFQDFTERVDLVGREVTLNLAIMTDTRPEYKSDERYENSFVNCLYPLHDLLIKYMARNKDIEGIKFEYDKTDRLYWGKSAIDGSVVNDFVDAIEITNLKLRIINC